MERAVPVVLIVDDDDEVRRILVELVESRGHVVIEASDGEAAWVRLLSRRVDVVVSDLQMPQCDGRELCRRIRGEPSLRDIRIVVITGCEDHPHEHDLKCDTVLRKPISASTLFHELETARQRLDTESHAKVSSGRRC
jgi:CheY-like chemotaxis protein